MCRGIVHLYGHGLNLLGMPFAKQLELDPAVEQDQVMRFDDERQDIARRCSPQIDDIIGIFGRDLRLAVARAT